MTFYILIGWYLIGFFSTLFTFAYINKNIFNKWCLTIGDLTSSIFLGLLGLLVIIPCLIDCIGWFLENDIDFDKKIWEKK